MSQFRMTLDEVSPSGLESNNKNFDSLNALNHVGTIEGFDDDDDDDDDEVMHSETDRNFDDHLPKTVTLLHGKDGAKLYLVGTAHFSHESQNDVSTVIRAVRPHIVVVELCKSRASILEMDEETIERETRNMTFDKVRMTLRDNGVLQGLMYLLLLNLSAQLTKDLGMAPGGEFRRAFTEVKRIRCILHFGDRPIQVTLKRALNILSWWKCLRLAWCLIFNKQKVSKEDVEKCKESDLLASMLKEMTCDFPELGQVFVQERDVYLTYSLQLATNCRFITEKGQTEPTVIVGVVGIGHTPGIKEMWGKVEDTDIPPIMVVKEQTYVSRLVKKSLMMGVLALVGWQVFRFTRNTTFFTMRIRPFFTSFTS